jgi:hypothetical protein
MSGRQGVLLFLALIVLRATVTVGLRGRSQELSNRPDKESATSVQEGVVTAVYFNYGGSK